MENIGESTSELALDSVRPLTQVGPPPYVSAGFGTESKPADFTDPAVSGGVSNVGAIASIDDGGGLLVGSGDFAKRKRGRPRKYDPDGTARTVRSRAPSQQGRFTLSSPTASFHEGGSSAKRGRGRPKLDAFASLGQLIASASGGDFTPHVVTVGTGEDVAGKILAFAQEGYDGVCVLSANGTVTNVTLRQPCSYGGLLTHEGLFEILTLKGSYTISEKHGLKSRSGGLSVSLGGSNGSVIGGVVAGSLMAANPIQIVLATFVTNGSSTQKRKINTELPRLKPHAAPSSSFSVLDGSTPVSHGPREGNVASQFPVHQSQGQGEMKNCFSNEHALKSPSNGSNGDWDCSRAGSSQIPYPDINLSVNADEQ